MTVKLDDLNTGAFVIFINPENTRSYLWVKHGYGDKKWSLPGGGVKFSEMVNRAAVREGEEETGLKILGPLQPIAIASLQKKYGVVILFRVIRFEGIPLVNGTEITEAKYMTLEEIQEYQVYQAQKRLAEIYEYAIYKLPEKSCLPVYCTLNDPPIIEI